MDDTVRGNNEFHHLLGKHNFALDHQETIRRKIMAGLDTKMSFTLKDMIFLITFLASGIGGYVTITSDVDQLKKEVAVLTEANKAYTNLPRDVQKMQKDIAKNAKTTTAIYYGLVAKGIIPPPKQ